MVFGVKAVTLLTFGLHCAIILKQCVLSIMKLDQKSKFKEASPHESSHRQRRGAAVLFKIRSSMRNLEASPLEGEFAQALQKQ